MAQSSVRCWAFLSSDTASRELPIRRIAAGAYATFVIRADGRVFMNGQNVDNVGAVPAPPPGCEYADISFRTSAVGLLTNGGIVTWSAAPWAVGPAPSLPLGLAYAQVAAGDMHALAVRSDGVAIGWSNPTWDLDGAGVVPSAATTNIMSVYAGTEYSLALRLDGSLVAWGNNDYGQCNVPALPPGMSYRSACAGKLHALAIRSDGALIAWGDNQFGQCNVPPLPAGLKYLMASAGDAHGHALRSDGVIVTIGNTSLGQGNVPTLPAGSRVVQMVSGDNHTVVLLSDGQVLGWGDNVFQQAFVPTLPKTLRPLRYVGVAAGSYHNLALLSDGSIQGWGADAFGLSTPPASFAGQRFVKVVAGYVHNAALRDDGQLFAWGNTSLGRCNVPPLPSGVRYVDFALADTHSAALRSDGQVVAWGTNTFGEGVVPALPPGLTYAAVDVYYTKTLLLRSDGTLAFAGSTSGGQDQFPLLPTGLRYDAIAASRNFNTALRSDGTAVWWGSLVTTIPEWRTIPTLPFGVCYVGLDGGYPHVILRRSDGRVEACGLLNAYQGLVPALDPGTSYVEVAAFSYRSAARVGPTSTYVSFTPGCAGSLQPARLIPRDTPSIGKTLPVNVFDLPHSLAILLLGFQRLTPSVPLAALGMPNCDLHVTLDATFPLVGADNQAQWKLTIPDDQSLVGVHFFNQAIVFDAAAGNGLGAVMSNAAEGVIGHW